jgi:transcriptional regulator with GAF, ATPase, and Fis domain
MTDTMLKRILANQREVTSLLENVIHMMDRPVAVRDLESNLLLGSSSVKPDEFHEIHSILCDGEVIARTSGGDQSKLVADLLTYLVAREAEKEELLDEVLDLYRQINLLFNLSEKLATSLELETVAKLTLDEACRLIEATGGAVVLLNKAQEPNLIVTVGHAIPTQEELGSHGGIVTTVLAESRAEIINDVTLDPRYVEGINSIHSILCSPLTSKNKSIGAIILVNELPVLYTAADLSLLNTLASQAAPAIENALLYQRTLQEAQEREERLLRQVQELRIELDEVRQQEKVAEITSSEYYQRLRNRADSLRKIIGESSIQ